MLMVLKIYGTNDYPVTKNIGYNVLKKNGHLKPKFIGNDYLKYLGCRWVSSWFPKILGTVSKKTVSWIKVCILYEIITKSMLLYPTYQIFNFNNCITWKIIYSHIYHTKEKGGAKLENTFIKYVLLLSILAINLYSENYKTQFLTLKFAVKITV